MSKKRVNLYERLPEIYRIKDAEQTPPYQLRQYLALVEEVFDELHRNIEASYDDHFIETCDAWVIPYLGDLLGSTPLKGDEWTLRADVADTIALRRRKGTLGAIELLTYDLTGWGVYCLELRERLAWNQHLNHQRPDEGGASPHALPGITRQSVVRGGTATVRDPALLSLLNSPFAVFSYTADVKPFSSRSIRYNLPNLAIFLWRLAAYRIEAVKPGTCEVVPSTSGDPDEAPFIARFIIHPLGQPMRLFNVHRPDPKTFPLMITGPNETPGPLTREQFNTKSDAITGKLPEGSLAGDALDYMTVDIYDPSNMETRATSDAALQVHLPKENFGGTAWTFRGANLCAWEHGLRPALREREIAIDPVIGRIAFGIASQSEGDALRNNLLITYTYGAVGPVGAHPSARRTGIDQNQKGEVIHVEPPDGENGLQKAMEKLVDKTSPVIIEIPDNRTYILDLNNLPPALKPDPSAPVLLLSDSLVIKSKIGARPVVKLARPLRFRPKNIVGQNTDQQAAFDKVMKHLTVRLEGLYITRGDSWSGQDPLISGVALSKLEIAYCTLDPGGSLALIPNSEPERRPVYPSMKLDADYGLIEEESKKILGPPDIILFNSVSGPLFIATNYSLSLHNSIVDAGSGPGGAPPYACSGAGTNPADCWGPPTYIESVTVFGAMRVEKISGRGGIWTHSLQAHNNQTGCIKYSYFSGEDDRLPQNHACVKGTEAHLQFTSEVFGQPGYGQLALASDERIRERGPGDDAMGAFNFLLEAHKWRNLQIRFREFMPVGVRPLLIPVT